MLSLALYAGIQTEKNGFMPLSSSTLQTHLELGFSFVKSIMSVFLAIHHPPFLALLPDIEEEWVFIYGLRQIAFPLDDSKELLHGKLLHSRLGIALGNQLKAVHPLVVGLVVEVIWLSNGFNGL